MCFTYETPHNAGEAPVKHAATGNRYVVPMVVKTLKLLEVFRNNGPRLSLTDIVAESGIPKASTYRILETLCGLGYVSRTEQGLYRLTFRLLDVAGVVQERNLLRKLATPHLEELQRRTGETVNLGLLEDDEIVYVEVLESSQSLRMVPRVGSVAPLHATSLGKAIAAHLPPEELTRLTRGNRLRRLTDRTITNDLSFQEQLANIRADGFAVDDQEETSGCTCVGAAILNAKNDVLGAVSVSAPSSRTSTARVNRIGKHVRDIARLISQRFRFTPETSVHA